MTLLSPSIYMVFVDPHQGNKDVMPFCFPTTKAYVEFIGREKARAYLQCIIKSNLRSKESFVIQSNQDVHVCGYMVANPNSTLLLKSLSLF